MPVFTGAATLSTLRAAKGSFGGNLIGVTSTYSLTAALTSGQVIQMIPVPKGARVHNPTGVVLSSTDLDTGATPAISLSVGDGDDVDRYVTDSTIGRTSGIVAGTLTTAAFNKVYTADDTIDVLVSAAPVTGATTGTITLQLMYEAE